MNTVNEPLIRAAVKAVEEHEANWNQGTWIAHPRTWFYAPRHSGISEDNLCGTTLCFAGFVLRVHLGRDEFRRIAFIRRPDNNKFSLNYNYPWPEEAAKAMGLEYYQALSLFSGTISSVDSLKAKITEVTGIQFD